MLPSGCMASDNQQPEMTVKAVGLGLLLAFVFGSANAYLGMKAGQTVAATIPAAVIALALFRLPWFKGGVLEQNIARTAASVGEALVAGAIFTIPAFMLADVGGTHLWTDLQIALLAGLLHPAGRRADRRILHHSAAAAAVRGGRAAVSGERGQRRDRQGRRPRQRRAALPFRRHGIRRAAYRSSSPTTACTIFREFTQGFLAFPRSVVQHFDFNHKPLGEVVHGGGIPWTTPCSLARADRHRLHHRAAPGRHQRVRAA